MTRFPFNWEKSIQAIDYLASLKPGITQYYIGKIIFFADREHLLDYGRPITGDRFVAMEHGPVPSTILDLLKTDSGYPDEIVEELHDRIAIEPEGNKLHVYTKGEDKFYSLSGSDKEYLAEALEKYGSMSFAELKRLSHEDPAYESAWEKPGANNEMDIELWFAELADPEKAKQQFVEAAKCTG
ncbi:Panacea domain-containing protein [Emcibacter nanhaiensis]|uniref:DUF4065 domain-containing protein n=1 Tax=Emcibacter nanhaiensis TaxID=1505037 RepID=A0A501PP98_9PROT|nr:Panacea domain-containing protein [Emcibacter nanhaiensis]TPD61922.1 DUF4065 domain-containing protein [Emcibacter nanhaiensis]